MGEVAWELEQTLNMWLRQDLPVTPELLTIIGDGHALFTRWVDALEGGGSAMPDPTALVARVVALRSQEPVSAVVPGSRRGAGAAGRTGA